jgi:L-lactate dehydrogenase (cytochrome)
MNLRLLGAQTIRDVVPAMVDTSNIHTHLVAVPPDQLYDSNCTGFAEPVGTNTEFFFSDQSMQHARLRDIKAKTKL